MPDSFKAERLAEGKPGFQGQSKACDQHYCFDARIGVTRLALYLQLANDRLVPPDAALTAMKASPAMKTIVINGPHGLLQASPAPAAQIVAEFVREVDRLPRKRNGSVDCSPARSLRGYEFRLWL